jgi:hypothetical protein
MSRSAPRRAEQLNLLTKLASQVDPEFRAGRSPGERTSASGKRRCHRWLFQDLGIPARR